MTYSFRNRFKLGGNWYIFDDYRTEQVLAEPPAHEARVILKYIPETDETWQFGSKTDELVLEGSGYPDFDTANEAGRRWRHYLTMALPRDGRGADFGDENEDKNEFWHHERVVEQDAGDAFAHWGIKVGDRMIQDRHGLMVYVTEPPGKFYPPFFGKAEPIKGLVGSALKSAAEYSDAPFDARQKLAYALVHQALFDTNPETRYIQLVTAIEAVLPDKSPRSQPIQDALDKLIATANAWLEGDTRSRVIEILNGDRSESIRQAAVGLVSGLSDTYDGLKPKRYFDLCYGNRSALVHGTAPRPDVRDHRTLLRFVLDVLDVYAKTKSEDL